jgi:peptide/nickel transport system ATP-binding protein/oligopeptide transport system ATP-binding protein
MACPSAGPAPHAPGPLLEVRHLRVSVETASGPQEAVHGVSFTIDRGETLGLVGESGSGKSLTARALVRLLPRGACLSGGKIAFEGLDIATAPEADLRRLRGGRIGFVFQEPAAALSPVYTIGEQVAEAVLAHEDIARREATVRASELLAEVGMPDPARRARAYPHQLSGGLRQRAMLAIALACRPSLLIADEPTTALDATLQADILVLLRELRDRRGLALLLVTHDLGVLAQMADRVAVMYAGRLVEEAPVASLFAGACHPYTRGLLAAIPGGTPGSRLPAIPGTPPLPGVEEPGCAFAPRCPMRFDLCGTPPPRRSVVPYHSVRCYLSGPAHLGAPTPPAGVGDTRRE